VFPGHQQGTWTWDEEADAWYHHRFYDFQPDLDWANPAVRLEIAKIVGFWLQMGVSGFRLDAAPFASRTPGQTASTRRGCTSGSMRSASTSAGAGVMSSSSPRRTSTVTRSGVLREPEPPAHAVNFALNERLFLALAGQSAAPVREALRWMPTIASSCGWATFLRLHDEVDLSR
jgi:maltose alpha-D-glucosyltransferase/alpha-amylase